MWKILLFLSLFWRNCLSKPLVDPGVFVLQGVDTCGNSRGYCLLGLSCTVDKDFLPDRNGGHCQGLSESFSSKISFICCRYAGDNSTQTESYFTTTSSYTNHDFEFEKLEANPIDLELSDEIPQDVDLSSLVNIIGVITDRTGIVSLVTEPYTGKVASTTPPSMQVTTAAHSPDGDQSTEGNLLTHKFNNNEHNKSNNTFESAVISKIRQQISPHNEIPIDVTFLEERKKIKNSSNTDSVYINQKEATTKQAYTLSTRPTTLSSLISTVGKRTTIEKTVFNVSDFMETKIKSDLIRLKTVKPATKSVMKATTVAHTFYNSTILDSAPDSIDETSIVLYDVVEGEVFNGIRGILHNPAYGLPAKSEGNYVLAPFPTNGNTCGIRKLVEKRRRFAEPSTRGSTYDYCWSVAIMIKAVRPLRSTFMCNGALIEPDLIVTTASCLSRIDTSKLHLYRVVLGDSALYDELPYGIQYHDISNIIIHHSYRHKGDVRSNDIGLIKMKDQATLKENVCLVCVPQKGAEISKDYCISSGYMMQNTFQRLEHSDGYLRSRTVVPQDFNSCRSDIKSAFSRTDIVSNTESLICDTFKLSSEICHTNNTVGSPLTCMSEDKWYLAGLFSWGTDCTNQSTVYTRVSCFSDWILATRIHLSGFITHKFLGIS